MIKAEYEALKSREENSMKELTQLQEEKRTSEKELQELKQKSQLLQKRREEERALLSNMFY